jgi:hypothetical protein
MTAKRIALVGWLLTLVVGVAAAPCVAQPSARPAGHWEGSIEIPGQALAVSVDFFANADKTWDVNISIPAQNVKAMALGEVTVKDTSVSFAMKGVPGEPLFKGKLSADESTIAGDFSQGGATLPFSLVWKGEATRPVAPKSTPLTADLVGEWRGALDVNGTSLRLILKLAVVDGLGKGTITSVDQGSGEIPIAAVVQQASRLRLDVSVVSATFEGELKDGQIGGTWTQGNASLPLVFAPAPK